MASVRKTVDPFPLYPQAGLGFDKGTQSTQLCISPPEKDPVTPNEIKKYRQSFKQRHGPHYGVADDKLPPKWHRYGLTTLISDHVGDIFNDLQSKGVNQFLNQIKEAKYASNIKEPLGKTINRNYKLSQQVLNENFKYGVPTEQNQFKCKDILYPHEYLTETEEVKKMYLKSHGNSEAGYQKNRQYNWSIDPKDFRFGKLQTNVIPNQIDKILKQDCPANGFPETKIIKKNQEDFRNYKMQHLGSHKNLAQTNPYVDQNTTYGKKGLENQWTVGQCIRGQGTLKDVLSDKDLGKCIKAGLTNIPKTGDYNKVFGVPTIRTDIPKPEQPSVADPNVKQHNQNYGNQSHAIQLLFPQNYAFMGLSPDDFLLRRPKKEVKQFDQIKEIFENIGYVYQKGKFEAIFYKSMQIEGTILQWVSCRSFLKAIEDMDKIIDII